MNQGIIHPFGRTTPFILLGTAIMMAVPSVMVFAPLALRPVQSRWANLVLGPVYGLIIVLTMVGAPLFYLFFGTVEVLLSALIAYHAWAWPRIVAEPR